MPSIEPLKEPGYEYPQSKTDILCAYFPTKEKVYAKARPTNYISKFPEIRWIGF
jgi:hypothetical protein